MTKKSVFIRVDAGIGFGMGHIMRCMALAETLNEHVENVTFLSHCDNTYFYKRIMNEGFDFIPIQLPHPDHHDLKQTLNILDRRIKHNLKNNTWIVIDGYHFTTDYQKAVRASGYKLLVIDDSAHLDHYHADILLNQNFNASDLHYSCEEETVKLFGPEYVLLNKSFFQYEGFKRQFPEKAKKILVALGGVDSNNVTLKVLIALNYLNNSKLDVKIIVGKSNPHIESLEKELTHSPFTFQLLKGVNNMPELMAWADLAVSGGGSICWELAFMGLPSLVIPVADNQLGITRGLAKFGAAVDLGWYANMTTNQFAYLFEKIRNSKTKRVLLAEQAKKLISGMGKINVKRAMFVGPITLRKCQKTDYKIFWRWANQLNKKQEATFNRENFERENYKTLFYDKLNDFNFMQYIALNKCDVPIGQISFSIHNSIFQIDCSVDEEFCGMGLEAIILERGIELLYEQDTNHARFKKVTNGENELSNPFFNKDLYFEANDRIVDYSDIKNKKKLSITIISDKKSWINYYIPKLISKLVLLGHTIIWRHDVSQIKEGDIVFYLGCEEIVKSNILLRNRNNIVVHESALPQGKGWSPLTWQILEGNNEVPISLLEAEESVDSGKIYIRDLMYFNGTELVEELRQKQAKYTIDICTRFINEYPGIISKGELQVGESTFYARRGPEDSKLDVDKTIREQFNLLRTVDNERYPACFELNGIRYTLKIYKM